MPEPRKNLATPEEVAEWLQITPERLAKLRQSKKGPAFIRYAGTRVIRYAWTDVHAWCNANREVTK